MVFDLIDYIVGLMKMFIYKCIYLNKLSFDPISKISRKTTIRIFNKGKLMIGKKALMRSGVKIRINGEGKLIIGDRVGFNNNCLINCMENIIIGDNVIFGQGVKIYDHDHIYKTDGIIRDEGYIKAPITIGNNVWIGSNVIILKGTTIESGSVIAANTVVKGHISSKNLVYNQQNQCTKRI